MKKALFLINSIGNGGAERVAINMANELIAQGFDVDFLTLKETVENAYDDNPRIRIRTVNALNGGKFRKIISIPKGVKEINRFVKESGGDYNLITSHLPMSNILTRFSCVGRDAIYVFHTKVCNYKIINNWFYGIILRRFFKKRKIVAVSDGVRDEAIKNYHMDKRYIKTIYNPINVSRVMEYSSEKVALNRPYILCVGRFNEAKRQDRVVKIFYDGEYFKKYLLIFCGVGEEEENVKRQVEKLGIRNSVRFLGWQKNIYKYMKNAALLISASDYEAFPMNLVEAMACGTKVVAGDCDFGPREILTGKYAAFLVKDKDDISAYIKIINKALDDYPTDKNEVMEKCRPDNCIKEYIQFKEKKI